MSERAVNALVGALGMDRDQVRALLDKLPEHLKKVCLEAANSPQGKCSRQNCNFDHTRAKLNEAKQFMAPFYSKSKGKKENFLSLVLEEENK